MSKIEFFTIEVYDKKSTEIIDLDLSLELKNKLDKLHNDLRICKKDHCTAILSEYILNIDNKFIPQNITFDFSRLKDEFVNSVILSNASSNTDTLKELNQKTMELAIYTEQDVSIVKEIIEEDIDFSRTLIKLKDTKIDYFSIYKIISDFSIIKTIDGLTFEKYFYDNTLSRLKKDTTFFNLLYVYSTNIISIQKNSIGFDFKNLAEYLNLHIFKDDNFSVKIRRIYEDGFSDILSHSDLKNFEFTYKFDEKSILDKNELNKPFYAISDYFGLNHNSINISVNSDKGRILNNEKIIEFFNLLKETGLMQSCKVKKANERSSVDSTSIGSALDFTTNRSFELLEYSNSIFLDAYNSKYNTILDKIKKG